jgi:hypothetical protein
MSRTNSFGIAALVLGMFLATGGVASAAVSCNEAAGGIPTGRAGKRATLQPNTARNSVLMSLGRHDDLADDISFSIKGGPLTKLPKGEKPAKRRRRMRRSVTADVVEWPRTSSERLDADVDVEATPSRLGNRVILEVCVERNEARSAGQFEGAISISGPHVAEFTYPIVVTTKWSPVVPIAVLALAIAAFIAMAYATSSLTFGLDAKKKTAGFLGLAIAVAAGTLTYWGQYGKNPTWGDDPGSQITALAIAGFTAAVGGLAAAQRLLRPDTGGGGGQDGGGGEQPANGGQ